MPMRGYHLRMSWAMNSMIVDDATYCISCMPNTPTFGSLSICTQAFTYIKVYESHIHNPSFTQDLGIPQYEHHK
ncbi:Ribosomal RNA small subunit methyltransferase A [Gossypium arboreum]|uniref:Ribosomal RNA small subunit methyltransferase A n=1 Tax=Gossypium arboreum TaxID=29729 RepID=A0A0B0MYC0_GOSAR|nr:Ribosomal RNA small subunit methyltransferase A [Gossypium arboreum]KHG03926.1 Ribosomal RNA small subunit methyltransferase A [Gossypium arboreum]